MIKELELKEELNKLLVRMNGVPSIDTMKGMRGNNTENAIAYHHGLDPDVTDEAKIDHNKVRLVILKSIMQDICFDRNDTYAKLDSYFLSW